MTGARRSAPVATSVALLLALANVAPAGAHTYRPTRFDDPPPGQCKPHDCSLREAILKANDDEHPDTVALAKGTYKMQLALSGPADAGGSTGDFNVVTPMTVRGRGPTKTKIDAGGIDRVFTFTLAGEKGVKVEGLSLTGGDPGAGFHPTNSGGGLLADTEKLTLDHVAIRKNEAVFGGGLRAVAQDLTIKDSTIAQNAASEGGGIDFRSALDVAHTLIESSTISGNSALKGGGILADGFSSSPAPVDPDVNLVNSTVAGNNTSAEGGGIMADNDASVTLGASTVAYNRADVDNVGGGVGGGIHQHSGATFVFSDSVLAANEVGSSGADPQCNGSFTSNSGAVVEVQPSPCPMTGSPALVGGALIGPLAQNGGPTKTIKLLAGSPAIGRSVECANKDQRGVKRPPTGCDSGAYERKAP